MPTSHDFRIKLKEYFLLVISDSKLDTATKTQLYQELLDMIEEHKVPRIHVVEAFSDIAKLSDDTRAQFVTIMLMRAITAMSEITGESPYPEFFWILVSSGFFTEIEILDDNIMSSLRDICDVNIIRSYLTHALITHDKVWQSKIVRAFYYTGYTVDVLKTITDVLPAEESNLDLYNFIYMGAMSYMFSERTEVLKQNEKDWLKAFFTTGLSINHEGIIDSCQHALQRLETLSN